MKDSEDGNLDSKDVRGRTEWKKQDDHDPKYMTDGWYTSRTVRLEKNGKTERSSDDTVRK